MIALPPIPDLPLTDEPEKGLDYREPSREKLVDLCRFSDGRIRYQPVYFEKGYPGAVNVCYAREGVARRLLSALELLPSGFTFLVFDAWRPYEVQKDLFDEYLNRLRARPENAALPEETLYALTRQFVSMPSRDPLRPYVHGTGGAVDLTILDQNGRRLDMGTEFDDFTPKAHAASFERETGVESRTIRDNRRLLFHVMTASGFVHLPSEWWHFDYGDPFWARSTGEPPQYATIFTP